MSRRRTYYTDHGITLALSLEDALSASHSGPCDEDVHALAQVPYVAAQLAGVKVETLKAELLETGAWDLAELQDHTENLRRLLWIAAGSIREDAAERGQVAR